MVRLADVPGPERHHIENLECPSYASTPFVAAPAASERHVALVSSAGFIVRGERALLARDTGYRAIASSVPDNDVLCSHVSTNFDRTGFQQDLNVMLPRDRLNELQEDETIGKAAETHYSFMGATAPEQLEDNARTLGRALLQNGVNTLVLAPV